jgi:hypothetical protein
MLRSSRVLSFRFSRKNLACISVLSLACHMPHASYSLWFDQLNNTWAQMSFQHPILKHPRPLFFSTATCKNCVYIIQCFYGCKFTNIAFMLYAIRFRLFNLFRIV